MRVLLTGDYERDEFAAAVAEMRRAGNVVEIACLQSAAEWLKSSETPAELIVVAQARPGQFSVGEIEALRRYAPLTPIVALLGTWCEGEMRSGSPWPGVTRVYWHQWPTHFQQEFKRLARGERSAWHQPLTATGEERLLWSAKPSASALRGVVAVVSDDCEMADWLASACRQRGMSAIAMRQPPADRMSGVDVVLWDAGLPLREAVAAFQIAASRFGEAKAIVLASFPRSEDVQSFFNAGAAAVLSKPLMLGDLNTQLKSLAPE